MRKVGILLSLVLLFSFSYASALERPDVESEFTPGIAGLTPEQNMIFSEQFAACKPLFDAANNEPPDTGSQMLDKYGKCLIENLDVNKVILELLAQNEQLKKQNSEVFEQNEELLFQTTQLTEDVDDLADDSTMNTLFGVAAGAGFTFTALIVNAKLRNKK